MSDVKRYTEPETDDGTVDVDALLAAIHRVNDDERHFHGDAQRDNREGEAVYCRDALADAFELDIYDYRIIDISR